VIPVPVDDFVILFVQYRDHQTRWAVPARFTIAQVACHVIDHVDSPKGPKLNRKPGTEFSVHNLIGEPVKNLSLVTELKEGDHLLVVRKEEA
jgi:hypothetical protein